MVVEVVFFCVVYVDVSRGGLLFNATGLGDHRMGSQGSSYLFMIKL